MLQKIIIGGLIAVGLAVDAAAANIGLEEGESGISISGPIEPGDFAKFARFINSNAKARAWLTSVNLDSPGGDVAEAMKFARLFEASYTRVVIPNGKICASACFLMWSGAVDRNLDEGARLGVHRISWTSPVTDVKLSEETVGPAARSVESFLTRVGIPRMLIDKMNETSPTDFVYIDIDWFGARGLEDAWGYKPIFLDVVEKACGPNPLNTKRLMQANSVGASSKKSEDWLRCSSTVRNDNFRSHMKEIAAILREARSVKK